MSISVFGIRHHGPGCARSLRLALEDWQPDIVLIEGPPDAQDVLSLMAHEGMQPPVALLIYAPEEPKRAVYYPFTTFSPEWQALHYAQERAVPARFMDLPQTIQFARSRDEEEKAASEAQEAQQEDPHGGQQALENQAQVAEGEREQEKVQLPVDPIAELGKAAGYSDTELWWELQIEQRRNQVDLFQGILEAMSELRADRTPENMVEAQREAHMRQTIRTAQREGYQRIAVVCGAWHAPALVEPGAADADVKLLSGLKKMKVEATWIPWTNSRLSSRSGYGAGIVSPGWYEHLWQYPDAITVRWITRAAHLLREQGRDTSSASVIEAVRLGESLAALRDLPMPGLGELHESIQAVLCNGDAEPMRLIRDRLEIGERLGEVPPETPAVPLQRDLEAKQRRLRLKPSIEQVMLDLDLRKDTDRARSQLLHQLSLLKIPWGKLQRIGGKSGTFHEYWRLQWQVEFIVALIEANMWGNTIEEAASGFVCHAAESVEELPRLSSLLDAAVLADLQVAIEKLLQAIQKRAAISADVRHLMDSLPPLVSVARYGDVRQTKSDAILPVIAGLFERIVIGLPGACSSLDDDAARKMLGSIDNVQSSVSLLQIEEQRVAWQAVLRRLLDQPNVHGVLQGRCCRLLMEQNVLAEEEMQRLTGLALSSATPAPQAAAWIEGVLRGGGEGLMHLNDLWRALDQWMFALPGDVFTGLLPILRRAFANFQAPERRRMGEKIKHLYAASSTSGDQFVGEAVAVQHERALRVIPVLAHLMGVHYGN